MHRDRLDAAMAAGDRKFFRLSASRRIEFPIALLSICRLPSTRWVNDIEKPHRHNEVDSWKWFTYSF